MTRSKVPAWSRVLGDDPTAWLLESGPPWVKLGVLRDLLDAPPDDPAVVAAREELHAHPLVRECLDRLADWPEPALRRHDDAKHPLQRLKLLVDLGVDRSLPGVPRLLGRILASAGSDGQLRSLILDPETQEPLRLAYPCDAPILLGAALAIGEPGDPRAEAALEALLVRRERDGGWFCHADWRGMESEWRRRPVSCPIATLDSLWALSLLPASDARRNGGEGAELLLRHFEDYDRRKGRPACGFQAGKRFRRRKFPFVWYDVLHVLEVLTRFPDVAGAARLRPMVDAAVDETAPGGRLRAGSVWMAYKSFDFGQKREPSPTITFLLARVLRRMEGGA